LELNNRYAGDKERDFFVWVDPSDDLVRHNAGLIGTFTGGPIAGLSGQQPAGREWPAWTVGLSSKPTRVAAGSSEK
jgi:hypothetical protein